MFGFESSVVAVKCRGRLELHDFAAGGIELVQVGEEVIGRLVHGHLAAGNVLVDFPLTTLPLFGPEPRLIGWHGQGRAQLDHAVTAFEYLDLRARLIQVHPPA